MSLLPTHEYALLLKSHDNLCGTKETTFNDNRLTSLFDTVWTTLTSLSPLITCRWSVCELLSACRRLWFYFIERTVWCLISKMVMLRWGVLCRWRKRCWSSLHGDACRSPLRPSLTRASRPMTVFEVLCLNKDVEKSDCAIPFTHSASPQPLFNFV